MEEICATFSLSCFYQQYELPTLAITVCSVFLLGVIYPHFTL